MTFLKKAEKVPENEEVSVVEQLEKGLDFFQTKILMAANLSDKERKEILKSRESVSNFINKTLNSANKKIFNNTEILELILNYKPEIFVTNLTVKTIIYNKLKKDFDQNSNLAFLVFKNFIKEDTPKEQINFFISNIAGDNNELKEKLEKMFGEILENQARFSMRDTQKNFYNISDENIINLLINSKIVDKSGKIKSDTLKNINTEINDNLSEEELKNKENIFNFLLEKLNISEEFLENKNLITFVKSLVDLIKISKKVEKNNEENLNNPSQSSLEKGRGNNEVFDENSFEEDSTLLSFCYPRCLLSEIGNNYEIDLGNNNKTEISKEEYNKFNQKSLENYINFLQILKLTKLDFLFENKYKSGFLRFLNQKLYGFDYKSGDGFTEAKTLQTLTLIGNLIGIPEDYYKEGELGEFDGIISSINIFTEINSTGNINKKHIKTPGNLIGPGVIETRMLQLGILGENGGFSVEKSKEVLKGKGKHNNNPSPAGLPLEREEYLKVA